MRDEEYFKEWQKKKAHLMQMMAYQMAMAPLTEPPKPAPAQKVDLKNIETCPDTQKMLREIEGHYDFLGSLYGNDRTMKEPVNQKPCFAAFVMMRLRGLDWKTEED